VIAMTPSRISASCNHPDAAMSKPLRPYQREEQVAEQRRGDARDD
jgi:hypothetical protein